MNWFAGWLILMTLWMPQNAALCPDAPLPRLAIGERGEVAPDIDRLRLRVLPAVGTGEVQLLYAGNQFEVIGGPSCNGGFTWWRIATDTGASGWAAEGTWSAYYLRPLDRSSALCEQADLPWLHLLVTAACRVLATA